MSPKQFSCVECNEKFGSKAKLKAHLKGHQITNEKEKDKNTTGKSTNLCNMCDRVFSSPAGLKRHQNHSCELAQKADKTPPVKEEGKEESVSTTENHMENVDDVNSSKQNTDSLRDQMRDKITNKVQSLLDRTRSSRRRLVTHRCDFCHTVMRKRSKDGMCPRCRQKNDKSSSSVTHEVSSSVEEPEANSSTDVKEEMSGKSQEGSRESDEKKNDERSLTSPDENSLVENNASVHNTVHKCAVCNKSFSRKYHLYRHLQITACSGSSPPSHKCQVCGKKYTRKDNLREHLRAHAGEVARRKKHKCEYCEKQFNGTSLLRIHIRMHTGERPFSCDFCSKTFPSGGGLAKHRRIHTGEKPYECTECGCRFTLKGTLNRHMRIHTGVRPHKCDYCGKHFIQAGGLKAHLFYHTGQNGFSCDVCGKTFNRKARLQMHMNYVHNKIKPFECQECKKCFTRKEDLARHYILHTGEKPFQCPTCSKRFAIKPSLKLHLLTHTKEEPRSCHECGRAFIRKDCLLRHMRKRHRDLLDKILISEQDKKLTYESTAGMPLSRTLNEQTLCESIRELLSLLVDEPTLVGFGWPNTPVDEVLECVIRRCGHTPVTQENFSYLDRLRENSKLLFTVVIDDNAVKTLLNNQTVDEVILHVLRLARS